MFQTGQVSGAGKFVDSDWTDAGEARAWVSPAGLETLWFNTGTLCNIACRGCYIESTPRNNRLAYISRNEVTTFIAEAARDHPGLREIGFTGGEPFMNPDIIAMLWDALASGRRALVLTNAMKPMRRHQPALLDLKRQYSDRLSLRVSLDHYTEAKHEAIRGRRSWRPALEGLRWLAQNGFHLAVASRMLWPENEATMRPGFAALFAEQVIPINAWDRRRLVLFPEMDDSASVPEITERCWAILGKNPDQMMCAHSRMVIKRAGAARPVVVSCTLHPYDERFEMGDSLAAANRPISLNHPRCAKFCVLGGASCSA